MLEPNLEDVFLWPDGCWCYRCEFEDHPGAYGHMSDDYEVIPEDLWDAENECKKEP